MLVDLLYKEHCVVCGAPLEWICSSCVRSIAWLKEPVVPKPLPSGKKPEVPRVFASALYADKAWQTCIRAVKYERMGILRERLMYALFAWREQYSVWPFDDGRAWTIVPVPTNPEHLLTRGYDHMDVWIDVFSSVLPCALVRRDVVQRRASDATHAHLVLEASREEAAKDIFEVIGTVPERILLVDDVYTTGATLQTLASLLREKGAKEVEILVSAMGK